LIVYQTIKGSKESPPPKPKLSEFNQNLNTALNHNPLKQKDKEE